MGVVVVYSTLSPWGYYVRSPNKNSCALLYAHFSTNHQHDPFEERLHCSHGGIMSGAQTRILVHCFAPTSPPTTNVNFLRKGYIYLHFSLECNVVVTFGRALLLRFSPFYLQGRESLCSSSPPSNVDGASFESGTRLTAIQYSSIGYMHQCQFYTTF
jgi:hypothetical protein